MGVLACGLLRVGMWVREIVKQVTTHQGADLELALCGLVVCAYVLIGCILGWHFGWLFRVGGRFGWGLLSWWPAMLAEHPLSGPLAPQVLDAVLNSPLVTDPRAWAALVF